MSHETVIASLKEKIDQLNEQAWEARVNDSPKAFELSTESVKLARSINYAKGMAEGLRSLGFCYVRLYKNDEAAPLLRESLSLFQSLNDLRGQAVVYEYLGIIERNWGNLGHSLELLLKGNELINQAGPEELEITSCYQIGVTYKHLGNHDNALDYLYRSLSLSKQINLRLMEAYNTNIIGSIYFDNGNYQQALELYQQGLVIRRQSNDKWGEAGSLDNIGFTYLKLNDLEKAIDFCRQSLAICKSTDDKKGEANALLHLAEIYEQANDVNQASKFSNESLQIRKERGDKRGEAEVLLFLASLHKNQNDVRDHQISEWLSAALKIADEIKAQDLLSRAFYNMHEYYSQKGDFKRSLAYLESHLHIEKELHKNAINQKVSNLEISHKAETISQRNKELTELNEKIARANNELKIEASLERVRTVAMGMKEPADMLFVCRMISDQLQELGFKEIRNVQTVIIYPQKHEYLNYQYFTPYDKDSIETIDYRLHPDVLEFTNQMLASPDAYYTKSFEGKELDAWRTYRKQTNQLPDPKLDAASSSHYYFYSIGSGALGVTTYAALSGTQVELFKRFRNVFELAYQRFIDIEKAEAQAREAQIEAALERVRSRSMGMQKSEELKEVIQIVFEQLIHLNINAEHAGFVVDYKSKADWHFWIADKNEIPSKITHPYFESVWANQFNEAKEKGKDLFTTHLDFEEKNKFYQELLSYVPGLPEESKQFYLSCPGLAVSTALQENVSLYIENFSGTPYTDEENAILIRFGKVFEQTYTRFLDLQKAEAQTREAQIEAALERVRSQAMAMRQSADLLDIVVTMRNEFTKLGHEAHYFWYMRWLPDKYEKAMTSGDGTRIGMIMSLPRHIHGDIPSVANWEISSEPALVYTMDVEAALSYVDKMVTLGDFELVDPNAPTHDDIRHINGLTFIMARTLHGEIGYSLPGVVPHPPADDIKTLIRFANVFDLAYRRFEDLKLAEQKNRETEIELALEKVRSRTMAMHQSSELIQTAELLFEQLKQLGAELQGVAFAICDENSVMVQKWTSIGIFSHPYNIEPGEQRMYEAWKNQSGLYEEVYEGERQKKYYEAFMEIPEFRQGLQKFIDAGYPLPTWQKNHAVTFKHGYLLFITTKPFNETQIFLRFGKVFEQTYTRFLDLQKAEAQAREAQIEAALEKVRAKVMSMTTSGDLNETSLVFGEQLRKLGIDWQFSYFWLIEEEQNKNTFWITWPDNKTSITIYTLEEAEEYFNECLVSWKAGIKIHDNYVPTGEVQPWLDIFQRIADDAGGMAKEIMVAATFPDGVYYYDAMMKYGSLGICISKPATDEEKNIQSRFAIEFERAYTRFLDLQRAEAQAREAKIEAALERTRTQSMLMQHSKELDDTLRVFHEQVLLLGINSAFSFLWLPDEDKDRHIFWATWKENKNDARTFNSKAINYPLDRNEPATAQCLVDWKSDQPVHSYHIPPEGVVSYFAVWKELIDGVEKLKPEYFPGGLHYVEAFMKYGCFGVMIENDLSEEEKKILYRFSIEFERTYTRFLDLQKAEAQAREAQIEAALEKVRASTMAMQKSEDLSSAAYVLFQQFKELGQAVERIFIATFDADEHWVDLWGTNQGGNQLNKLFRVPVDEPTVIKKIVTAWKSKAKSLLIDLQGEELATYLSFLKKAGIPVIEGIMTNRRVQNVACFSKGVIGVTTPEPLPEESIQLLERFAGVFDLTYTRFLDLTIAETKAHEARIETALERVRARALAMQQPEELKEVAQVLRTEMGVLGIEELETCSIYIHEKDSNTAECWYALKQSNDEGKQTVADHFVLNLDDTWVGSEMKKFYNSEQTQTSIVMQGANRREWIEYCYKLSPVFSGFYGETIPDRTYHLYKFSHGYIGAAAPGEISGESWRLLSRAASVFSLAYSRFKDLTQARNDLIRLKEEKKRAEDALAELKATQAQLIQSEKMASLGELTAGIAHEIQNPLNFVNNFSDVSNELIEEMKEELATGNTRHAIQIADDVKDNLEKILHHGKRADGIVKSMLQHSRSSSGKKEPTSINSLCDEYLRLAFHGLRAKDKLFNAKFETDFDNSIEKINIVPQEIGRVILNLINNAFYAVNEKKSRSANGYEPKVKVSTKIIKHPANGADAVEISVKDNGDGISSKVLDKIFQPFFTTKPTGQGTGLGLSLSYDIVTKGHGGDLKVETKEGAGSEFIISLPVN